MMIENRAEQIINKIIETAAAYDNWTYKTDIKQALQKMIETELEEAIHEAIEYNDEMRALDE